MKDNDYMDQFDPTYSIRYAERNQKKISMVIKAIYSVDSILDIGCNQGYIIKSCLKKKLTKLGFGIELDRSIVDKELLANPAFTLFECDLKDFSFTNSYDIIIYNSVHHHIFGKYGRKIAWRIWQDIIDHCNSVLIFETGMVGEKGNYYWKDEILKYYNNDQDHLNTLFNQIGPRLKAIEPIIVLPIHGSNRVVYKIELYPKKKETDIKIDQMSFYGSYYSTTTEWETITHLQRTIGHINQKLIPINNAQSDDQLFDETDFYVLQNNKHTDLFCFAKAMPENPYKQMREFLVLTQCHNHPNIIKLNSVHEKFGLIFPYLQNWKHLENIDFQYIVNRKEFMNNLIEFYSYASSKEIKTGVLDIEPGQEKKTRKLIDIVDLHINNFMLFVEGGLVKKWIVIDFEYFSNNNRDRNYQHLENIRNYIAGRSKLLKYLHRIKKKLIT
jgi:hypothetical protein